MNIILLSQFRVLGPLPAAFQYDFRSWIYSNLLHRHLETDATSVLEKTSTRWETLLRSIHKISRPKMLAMASPIHLDPSRPPEIVLNIYFNGILPKHLKTSESLSRTQGTVHQGGGGQSCMGVWVASPPSKVQAGQRSCLRTGPPLGRHTTS